MKFFDSFWKASFYQEGKAVSFWRAFGKVVLVILLTSVGYATVFYATFGKNIPSYLHSLSTQALDGYPSDLIITLHDGELSKNIPGELHLYPIPEDSSEKTKTEGKVPTYIVTINDKESVSLELYQNAHSIVVLAKDGLISQDNKGIRIMSYKDMAQSTKDFTFTKSMIVSGVDIVNKYAESVPGVCVIVIVAFSMLFAPLGYLIATLLYGLCVMWLSTWILGRKTKFSESYILSMYALAPVIIVDAVVTNIPYVKNIVSAIPFFFLILIVVFLKYMFRSTKGHVTKGETM